MTIKVEEAENEGMQVWNPRHFPQKNEAAVVVHCFFTVAVMALRADFRFWKVRQESQPPETTLLGGEGTERWRRRLKAENRDRVIVFLGEHYGILQVTGLAVLSGSRIKSLPQELGSSQAILARFGLSP